MRFWLVNGHPAYLPSLIFFSDFGALQNHADTLFDCNNSLKRGKFEVVEENMPNWCFVSGLFLDGARWINYSALTSLPGKLLKMPVTLLPNQDLTKSNLGV